MTRFLRPFFRNIRDLLAAVADGFCGVVDAEKLGGDVIEERNYKNSGVNH